MGIHTAEERRRRRKEKLTNRILKLMFRIEAESGRINGIMDRGEPPTVSDIDTVQEGKERIRRLGDQMLNLLNEFKGLGN
ncbi:MAG: hypothetical protein HY435_00620 [Candidatus Liptonbacteria bacterium]|nr:hypothetical protein [Candidatus Liptonbacteria bacterium]